MKRALIGCAIAEENDCDTVFALEGRAEGAAQRNRQAGADNAVGAADTGLRAGDMHGAGIAVTGAVRAAENFGHERLQLHALGERVAMTAMRREDRVGRRQAGTHAGGDRFLADADVNEARDFAVGENLEKLFLHQPHAQHGVVQIHQAIVIRNGCGNGRVLGFGHLSGLLRASPRNNGQFIKTGQPDYF